MDIKQFRSDPDIQRILAERARALAMQQVETTIELGEEAVIFRLGNGRYSLPARFIREVHPFQHHTPLPSTPAFIVGLVNVRGRILTAIDLRPLLDIAATPPAPQSFLVIISVNTMEIGLLADIVEEVRRSEFNPSPSLSATTGRGVIWVRGVDQQLSVLIDPVLLLEDPRILVNDETDAIVNQ
ncbi:MAG: chemotaxis protein CheW [Chloroflexaceae bacterium]|nr:chemotaxis protein CheW [Chloroflexaceae bacterium]